MCTKFYSTLTILTIDSWREEVVNYVQSDPSITILETILDLSVFGTALCDQRQVFSGLRKQLLIHRCSFDAFIIGNEEQGQLIQGRNGTEIMTYPVAFQDYMDVVDQLRCFFSPQYSLSEKKAILQSKINEMALPHPLLAEEKAKYYMEQALLRLSTCHLCKECSPFVQKLIYSEREKSYFENKEAYNPFA